MDTVSPQEADQGVAAAAARRDLTISIQHIDLLLALEFDDDHESIAFLLVNSEQRNRKVG